MVKGVHHHPLVQLWVVEVLEPGLKHLPERARVDRIGVPLEADGIDVDGIEQALADMSSPW